MIVVSRSNNKKLYAKSMELITLDIKKIQSTSYLGGQDKALKYLLHLFDYDVDWVINIDEDAFVFDSQRVLNLIKFMDYNGYDYCGMPDGGIVNERKHNPIVPNAFFNIFNVKKIKINRDEIYQTKFTDDLKEYIPNILKTEVYQWNTKEQYYCLFFWLIKRYKCLFLNGYQHDDGISTILQDHKGCDFLIHTWCARTYGVESEQTERINKTYEWALKKSKTDSMLNIILRTHNRPTRFKRMMDCIQKQTFQNFRLYITVDNDETEEYVKEYHLPYVRLNLDTTIPYFYNSYFNDIYQKIDNGWIWGIDDDDILADDNVFQLIHDTCVDEDKIYIFKFHNKHARCIRPGRFFGKKIEVGDIGTPNFIVNRKYCCDVMWESKNIGDGLYISNLIQKIGLENVCWIDKVIYIVEKANHAT